MDIITSISLGFIGAVAAGYSIPLYKVYGLSKKLKECSTLSSLKNLPYQRIEEFTNLYQEHLSIQAANGSQKTTLQADEIFNEENMALIANTNMHAIASAPGILSGLGVLGTFVGLALAVANFDSSNTEMISQSIKSLLGGMGTAFYTSLLGMSLSLIYIFFQKATLNQLSKSLLQLCSSLDRTFYINQFDLLRTENAEKIDSLSEQIERLHQDNESLQTLNENGFNAITRGQTSNLQDILISMQTTQDESRVQKAEVLTQLKQDSLIQAQSIQQYTEDMAHAIKQIFNVSIQSQQRLMTENSQAIGNHITMDIQAQFEKLIEAMHSSQKTENMHLQSWAQDTFNMNLLPQIKKFIQQSAERKEEMHKELMDAFVVYDEEDNKVSVGNMLQCLYEESEKQSQALESFTTDLSNELNSSLGRTVNENIAPLIRDIENTHRALGNKLDTMTNQIQAPATDMVNRVSSELKDAMIQMTSEFKEQISTDTVNQMMALADNLSRTSEVLHLIPQTMEAMSDSIKKNFTNVQGLFGQIQSSIQDQQSQLIESSRNANDELALGMQLKFEEMMDTVKTTMGQLNDQHIGMMDTQSRSTREIERLLASFSDSVQRMHISNQETSNTLVKLQTICDGMENAAKKMNEISSIMADVSNGLLNQQKEVMQKYSEVQDNNQETIAQITEALDTSKALVANYSQGFGTIQNGLEGIFAQITEGLQQYSSTLRTTTGDALTKYSDVLTDTTKGLQNMAQSLIESAEEIAESIDQLKSATR